MQSVSVGCPHNVPFSSGICRRKINHKYSQIEILISEMTFKNQPKLISLIIISAYFTDIITVIVLRQAVQVQVN